jgi:hypothetical protein
MKHTCSIFSFVLKPFLILLLIVGVFGLVYLRSNFLTLEYSFGELEKKRMNCLKEQKMLLAEKTSLLSFAKLESSRGSTGGFVLPDRVKVIHISKEKRYLPYRASLERRQLTEP